MVRIYSESGFLEPDKPIRDYTEQELHDFLYKEPTKVKLQGINMTYEGLIPKIQKSLLPKDREAMQPHIRAFVDRAVTFTACPDCGGTRLNEGARSSKIGGINIADAVRDADQRPRRMGARARRPVGRAAAGRRCSRRSTPSSTSDSATSRSTGRRARCRAARRSARR